MAHGRFVSFEGIDGCGKSTHAAHLAEVCGKIGVEVVLVRDPGSTRLSEKIRALLLDPENFEMARECELLLYEAARAQLAAEVIRPALLRGAWVIADRFFDSTTAYQGGGRRIDASFIQKANELGSLGVVPDLTFILDLPVEEAARRRAEEADRIELEGNAFAEKVRKAYLALAEAEGTRMCVIDASGSMDDTFAQVAEVIGTRFGGKRS